MAPLRLCPLPVLSTINVTATPPLLGLQPSPHHTLLPPPLSSTYRFCDPQRPLLVHCGQDGLRGWCPPSHGHVVGYVPQDAQLQLLQCLLQVIPADKLRGQLPQQLLQGAALLAV